MGHSSSKKKYKKLTDDEKADCSISIIRDWLYAWQHLSKIKVDGIFSFYDILKEFNVKIVYPVSFYSKEDCSQQTGLGFIKSNSISEEKFERLYSEVLNLKEKLDTVVIDYYTDKELKEFFQKRGDILKTCKQRYENEIEQLHLLTKEALKKIIKKVEENPNPKIDSYRNKVILIIIFKNNDISNNTASNKKLKREEIKKSISDLFSSPSSIPNSPGPHTLPTWYTVESEENSKKTFTILKKDLLTKLKNKYKGFPHSVFHYFFTKSHLLNLFVKDAFSLEEDNDSFIIKSTEKVCKEFSDILEGIINDFTINDWSYKIKIGIKLDFMKNYFSNVRDYLYSNCLNPNFKRTPMVVIFSDLDSENETELLLNFSTSFNQSYAGEENYDSLLEQLKGNLSEISFSCKEIDSSDENFIGLLIKKYKNNIIEFENRFYAFGIKALLDNINQLEVIHKRNRPIEERLEYDKFDYFLISTGFDNNLYDHWKNNLSIRKDNPNKLILTGTREKVDSFKEFLEEEYLPNSFNSLFRKDLFLTTKFELEHLKSKRKKIDNLIKSYNGFSQSIEEYEEMPSLVLALKGQKTQVIIMNEDVMNIQGDFLILPINKEFLSMSHEFTTGVFKAVIDAGGVPLKKQLEKLNHRSDLFREPFILDPQADRQMPWKKLVLVYVPSEHFSIYESHSGEVQKAFENVLNAIDRTSFLGKIDIVCPLLSAGVNSRTASCSLTSILLGLISSPAKKFLQKLIIPEIDQEKFNNIKECVNREISIIDEVNYQFSWESSPGVFTRYDPDTTYLLNRAYKNSQISLKISLNPLHQSPTHEFCLDRNNNFFMTDLARHFSNKIMRYFQGKWVYIEGTNEIDFEEKINEQIELNYLNNISNFKLFCKTYEINFTSFQQINRISGYKRKIKAEPINNKSKQKSWAKHFELSGADEDFEPKKFQIFFRKLVELTNFESAYKTSFEKFKKKQESQIRSNEIKDIKVEITHLDKRYNHKEWDEISNRLRCGFHSRVNILKIVKINNARQKYSFESEKKKIMNPRETFLWHGTGDKSPATIFEDDVGFRLNYASDNGAYGRGLYFAENASYSDKYAYEDDSTNHNFTVKVLILAKVILGKQYECRGCEKFSRCPQGYDSVKGKSNCENIHVIYDHHRAYPEYLVFYH